MKRVAVLLFSLLLCFVSYADTINLHWMNYDGTNYQDSTCTVDDDLILPSTPPTRYGYTFTGWKISPYIPIEYLAATGTQYIDTGYKTNEEYIKIQIKFRPTTSSGNQGLLGAQTAQFDHWFAMNYKNKGYYIGASAELFVVNATTAQPNIVELTIDNGFAQLIHNEQILSSRYSGSIQSGSNIYLFDYSAGNNISQYDFFVGEVYYMRIYNSNDVLVRDFIPVLDKDGVPCMFDRVEAKFYYNQCTGNFIAGPILDE